MPGLSCVYHDSLITMRVTVSIIRIDFLIILVNYRHIKVINTFFLSITEETALIGPHNNVFDACILI